MVGVSVTDYNRLCPNSYWDFTLQECAPAVDFGGDGANRSVFVIENALFSDRVLYWGLAALAIAIVVSFLYYRNLKKRR